MHYFLLGDDAFALMPWMVKPYSRGQLTREERIANYRISRGRRVVDHSFGILVSRFRVLLGIMEHRPRVVRDIVFTCVVLHKMMRIHQGGGDRAPTPANDVAALRNEQVVYVPNENNRTGGQGLRCINQQPWGQKLASISPQDYYQSFSGLTNYSRTFI